MRLLSALMVGSFLRVMALSAQQPAFEVASVKPSPPIDTTPVVRFGPQPGGRWIATNATLAMLIEYLYPEYSLHGRGSQQFGLLLD